MTESRESVQPMRKSFACDECKRRKIRCSGGDRCANCDRDAKPCRYSSPSQRLVMLHRRLQESEDIRRKMAKAWEIYLPGVDLETALRNLPETTAVEADKPALPPPRPDTVPYSSPPGDEIIEKSAEAAEQMPSPPQPPRTTTTEHFNADDFEFDESEDPERSIDGMAFLTADPHKSGYTGPQSGIAALKFLQSLPPYLPITYNASPLSGLDDDAIPDAASHTLTAKNGYIDYYFELYHPAYPILHEGTFRARVAGALAKPRDGSWPLLYNSVLAIGAFVSGSSDGKGDYPFYKEARRHLSMDILEKGSLGYVQALTLLANYLQKRNKPNAGFILIGAAFSMAIAIGLHREFDMPSTSPFTMEVRRRTWWTLFVFISGAQLALGRPAASLAEVNVRLPANLDDLELAVDMEHMPVERLQPTVASCLIEQVKLAKIANLVQGELAAAHRRPTYYAKTEQLEESIRCWRRRLPTYFAQNLEPRLELPKQVLLWRGLNLRIVLNRPFLFEAIAAGAPLGVAAIADPISSCLAAADECAASICTFLKSLDVIRRGFAWYATAWLITASFVQATCLIYMPAHVLASGWKASLQEAVGCLQILGASLEIALRARDIIQNVLENRAVAASSSPGTILTSAASIPFIRSRAIVDNTHANVDLDPSTNGLDSMNFDDNFTWLSQGPTGAEFFGAAGSFVYGNGFDVL